jgi:hypothetical protein
MWPKLERDQPLLRPHFWPRQLVTADDLNSGVAYLVERARRHNRYLHGCGISCGLEISELKTIETSSFHSDWQLQLTFHVSAGAAISPRGDLILIDDAQHTFTKSIDSVLDMPRVLYLLVRHTSDQDPDHRRPTYPDECRHLDGAVSPTRLSEGYEFALETERPPGFATPPGQLCGPLLNRRSPQHEAELAQLMTCPAPVVEQEWLVVASFELGLEHRRIKVVVHYRDRTLLPSAQVLWQLLGCFPEMPCIKSATVESNVDHGLAQPMIAYIVTVTGYGLTPLREVIVGSRPFGQVRFDQNQENDRQIVFRIFSEWGAAPQGSQTFRIITEFDELNSANFDVYLNFPLIPHQPEPATLPANPINGGIP